MKLVHIFNHPHRQIDSFSNVNEWNSLHAEWSHETDSKLPVLGLVSPRHLGRVEIRRMVFLCKMKDDNTVRANFVNKFWADVRKPLLFSAAAMSLVLFYFKRILVQFSITIGHLRLNDTFITWKNEMKKKPQFKPQWVRNRWPSWPDRCQQWKQKWNCRAGQDKSYPTTHCDHNCPVGQSC